MVTRKDFEDLGVIFAYQEYGGMCSIYGRLENNKHIHVSFDEEWFKISEYENPNVYLYNELTKKKIDRFVDTKEELNLMIKEILESDDK